MHAKSKYNYDLRNSTRLEYLLRLLGPRNSGCGRGLAVVLLELEEPRLKNEFTKASYKNTSI
jgi:hypothetical protein